MPSIPFRPGILAVDLMGNDPYYNQNIPLALSSQPLIYDRMAVDQPYPFVWHIFQRAPPLFLNQPAIQVSIKIITEKSSNLQNEP
jgi:hypothetical protein